MAGTSSTAAPKMVGFIKSAYCVGIVRGAGAYGEHPRLDHPARVGLLCLHGVLVCEGQARALYALEGAAMNQRGLFDEPDRAIPEQEPFNPRHGIDTPTQTTAEAMELLERTRRGLIETARSIARELTAHEGTVTSRAVRLVMIREGTYNHDIPDYWLGAVFRGNEWIWTGQYELPTVPEGAGNAHAWRPVKVWRRR
jgi:hypothetical protein